MPKNNQATPKGEAEPTGPVGREQLIELLNEDLAREYQAIIAYVVYSQVLKGAEYMTIAKELEVHATEELQHALIISKQIDYLGGSPTVVPKPVKTSQDASAMLRFDLENENDGDDAMSVLEQWDDRVRTSSRLTIRAASPPALYRFDGSVPCFSVPSGVSQTRLPPPGASESSSDLSLDVSTSRTAIPAGAAASSECTRAR